MKICTITCHDVYNYGASLQAYALQQYLSSLGHDVKIIDYKPDYMRVHYKILVCTAKFTLLQTSYKVSFVPILFMLLFCA